MLHCAHIINFKRPIFFWISILIQRLNYSQIRMLHGFDLSAIAARAAWNPCGDGRGAVQCLGEAQCQSPAAQPGRSAEKIRVANLSARHMLMEHIHSPFVSE
jgi:hypothetical protein